MSMTVVRISICSLKESGIMKVVNTNRESVGVIVDATFPLQLILLGLC